MKSIKTYLLLLFLLALFGVQAFSQTSSEKEMYNKEYKFSKTDSVLAETYLTERDYIDKHGLFVGNHHVGISGELDYLFDTLKSY